MYFVKRGDTYHDVAGSSFRDLLAGKLPQLPGERATISDWANHLSTLFPEVRLKRYLEMRGADAGPLPMLKALPALWVGLLYDPGVLDAAAALVADWTDGERQTLRDTVPRDGLHARFRQRTVRDLALEVLELAHEGLRRRGCLDSHGRDETRHLAALHGIAQHGRTSADELLELYAGEWRHNVNKVFERNVL
jgi:glutamate--cysteine ligase